MKKNNIKKGGGGVLGIPNEINVIYGNNLIHRWKINSKIERILSSLADQNFFWKRIYCLYYKIFDSKYYHTGLLMIDKTIDEYSDFIDDYKDISSKKERSKLIVDMIYSLHRFGCMFNEYFLFEFYKLNTIGRNQFVTDKVRYSYYFFWNDEKNEEIFWNKGKSYEMFKSYYKRECLFVKNTEDNKAFTSFLQKNNNRLVIKPLYLSMGRGVKAVCAKQLLDDGIESLLDIDLYKDGFILEEFVEQSDKLAVLHPSSLNTIRICSVKIGDEVFIASAYLRIGRGGSFVDNAKAGGIIAVIDSSTGIVVNSGTMNMKKPLIIHPDTGVQIVGFKIPNWNELFEFVKELSDIVPTNRYTGWDLALTDNGWVLIEVNSTGGFVDQYISKIGLKKKLNNLLERL